jgi:RimJ/RimL family protein N-acetyltransferase
MSEELIEPEFIDSKCPYCGADISFPVAQIGIAQDCPICVQTIIVPERGSELAGKLPLPVQTLRLVLRRFKPEDWKDVLEFMSDEKLFAHTDWNSMIEEEVVAWLETDGKTRLTDDRRSLFLGIELTSSRKIVGCASIFFHDDTRRQAGFTVFVNRNYQRKGYGTEAARGAIDFWLRGLNLHRVTGKCDSRNSAACGMLEKAGLRREGEFLQDRFVNGEWVNTVCFGLLAEEYGAAASTGQ